MSPANSEVLQQMTPEDTGIWGEEHVAAWKRIVDFTHSQGLFRSCYSAVSVPKS